MKNSISASFILFCILLSSGIMMAGSSTSGSKKALPLQTSMDQGQKVYNERCLTCHQVDGRGVQNMFPPLIKTAYVLGDKQKLIEIVLHGLQGVDIEGESYHNVMAANTDLTDQQVADVLTYVRNSFGNKAKAVKPAEVKSVRAKLK
jgi:mono/diheme cytochrome c family protein